MVAELADGEPFGSFEYLSRRCSAAYVELLAAIVDRSSAAQEFFLALERHDAFEVVLRDPLVRRTIEDGVCALVGGLDAIDLGTLDAVLRVAAEHAAVGSGAVLESAGRCVPFRAAVGRGVVWADVEPDTLPGRRFVTEVLKRLRGFQIHAPTDDQIQALADGHGLALHIAPDLARSALSHICVVVLGDFEGQSARINALTVPGLPGVMVASPAALTRTSAVAETMVHESLHLKFLDMEYVHPLFVAGFRPTNSPRVTPPWHGDDVRYGDWPVDRLLTSMHVYLSLAVFFRIAADRQGDDFGSPTDCATRADKYTTRAAWLFDAAQAQHEHLSPAGLEFVAWMGSMLVGLESSALPR